MSSAHIPPLPGRLDRLRGAGLQACLHRLAARIDALLLGGEGPKLT